MRAAIWMWRLILRKSRITNIINNYSHIQKYEQLRLLLL